MSGGVDPPRVLWLVAVPLAGVLGLACSEKPPEEAPAAEGEQASAEEEELPMPTFGDITGIVRLASGATLPMRPALSGLGDQAPCPPLTAAQRSPVSLVNDRRLWNMPVFVTGLPDSPTRIKRTRRLKIHECTLVPAVITVGFGDRLAILNETNANFQPVLGDTFDELVTVRFRREQLFDLPESTLTHVSCPLGRACGYTDVFVLPHPYHSVTGRDGAFSIEHVPTDVEVTIRAWHPLFKEATAVVTVYEGEPASVEIVVEPAPAVTGLPRLRDLPPPSHLPALEGVRPTGAPRPAPPASADGEQVAPEPEAPGYTPEQLRLAL